MFPYRGPADVLTAVIFRAVMGMSREYVGIARACDELFGVRPAEEADSGHEAPRVSATYLAACRLAAYSPRSPR